jgi:hypothetical protein
LFYPTSEKSLLRRNEYVAAQRQKAANSSGKDQGNPVFHSSVKTPLPVAL